MNIDDEFGIQAHIKINQIFFQFKKVKNTDLIWLAWITHTVWTDKLIYLYIWNVDDKHFVELIRSFFGLELKSNLLIIIVLSLVLTDHGVYYS